MVMGFTYGEAAYACQETLSWQTTVIGDPLYRPFAKPLQTILEEQQTNHNPGLEWSYLRAMNSGLLHGKRPIDIAVFLESLPLTKQSAVLSEKLGDLYYAMGKPASAIETYQIALKGNPSPLQRVRLRTYLANVLSEQDKLADAVTDLKAILTEVPGYPGKAAIEGRIQDLTAKMDAAAKTPAAPPAARP